MSITSQMNGQTCTFIVPQDSKALYSVVTLKTSLDADNNGAPVFSGLLKLDGIETITISPAQGGFKIDIILSGKKWNDAFGRSGKTIEEFIKAGLKKKFIDESVPVISIGNKDHLKPDFIKAVQKIIDESQIGKRTIDHGGKIAVTAYDPSTKVLTLQFSGACVTKCAADRGEEAKSITEQMITNTLCQRFPNAFDRTVMRFVNGG